MGYCRAICGSPFLLVQSGTTAADFCGSVAAVQRRHCRNFTVPSATGAPADEQADVRVAVFGFCVVFLHEDACAEPGFDDVLCLLLGEVGAELQHDRPRGPIGGVCRGTVSAPLIGPGLNLVEDSIDYDGVELGEYVGRIPTFGGLD